TTVRLWQPATGRELRRYKGHEDMLRSVTFSPDGLALASVDGSNVTHLWRTATGKKRATLFGNLNSTGHVAFAPDGKTLYWRRGGDGREIGRVETATGNELPPLRGHPGRIPEFALSPDGQLLVTAGKKGLYLQDAATGGEWSQGGGHCSAVE